MSKHANDKKKPKARGGVSNFGSKRARPIKKKGSGHKKGGK